MRAANGLVVLFACVAATSSAWALNSDVRNIDHRRSIDLRGTDKPYILKVDPTAYKEVKIPSILLDSKNTKARIVVTLFCENRCDPKSVGRFSPADLAIDAFEVTGNVELRRPRVDIVIRNVVLNDVRIQGNTALDSTSPVVSVRFEESAAANDIELRDLTLDGIKLRVGERNFETRSKIKPAYVRLSNVRFQNVEIVGAGEASRANVDIRGEMTIPTVATGDLGIALSGLRLLKGSVEVRGVPSGDAGSTGIASSDACLDDRRRFRIGLRNIAVGEKTDQTDRLLRGGERGALAVKVHEDLCPVLDAAGVAAFGDFSLSAGFLDRLSLAQITSDSPQSGSFSFSARGLGEFRLDGISLVNVFLSIKDSARPIGVPKWGLVQTTGTVQLPSRVFDALAHKLSVVQGEELTAIRSFFVDTRWRSYDSEEHRPTAAMTLHAVLLSDAQRIVGANWARVLDWFTGFGVSFKRPLIVFVALIFLSLSAVLWTAKGGLKERGQEVISLLLGAPLGHGTPGTMSLGVSLARLLRLVIMLQIALLSLFIQNVVLVGF